MKTGQLNEKKSKIMHYITATWNGSDQATIVDASPNQKVPHRLQRDFHNSPHCFDKN